MLPCEAISIYGKPVTFLKNQKVLHKVTSSLLADKKTSFPVWDRV